MSQPIASLVLGLPVEVVGESDRLVSDARPLEVASPEHMAFVSARSQITTALHSQAGVLFVRPADAERLVAQGTRTIVITPDPKGHLIAALGKLRPPRRRSEIGISPHAFVHPNAVIGPRTNVHPGASIGSGVVIGGDCDIFPGVQIGPGCRIGNQVQIHPNVVLYHEVTIGDRVTIQAGCVIGADGFGYATAGGRHERLPHLGTVRIEADADIGANSCIDRAVIGETVIGEGTKIDNVVVIAHNCRLGKHNLLVSQVGFAGSVTTGDYVVCAGQVGVADHVHLGSGAVFGAKAGVHRDMPGGKTYLGAPAAPVEDTVRNMTALQKLPQLRKTIKELEKRVAMLTAQMEQFAPSPVREAA